MFAEAIDVILAIWERDPSLRDRSAGEPLQGHDGKEPRPGNRPRRDVQALPEAASRDRRHGGAPHSKGVIAMGERDFHPLSANFLAAALAAQPLGELRRGQAPGRKDARSRGVAHRPHHLRRRRRPGRPALRRARMPPAPTVSIGSSCAKR